MFWWLSRPRKSPSVRGTPNKLRPGPPRPPRATSLAARRRCTLPLPPRTRTCARRRHPRAAWGADANGRKSAPPSGPEWPTPKSTGHPHLSDVRLDPRRNDKARSARMLLGCGCPSRGGPPAPRGWMATPSPVRAETPHPMVEGAGRRGRGSRRPASCTVPGTDT